MVGARTVIFVRETPTTSLRLAFKRWWSREKLLTVVRQRLTSLARPVGRDHQPKDGKKVPPEADETFVAGRQAKPGQQTFHDLLSPGRLMFDVS